MTPASFELKRIAAGAVPDGVIALNRDYLEWVAAGMSSLQQMPLDEVLGASVDAYVQRSWAAVLSHEPPVGGFYAIAQGAKWCAMAGLRPLPDGSAEIKRLYVHPAYRGQRLGEKLLTHLLRVAAQWGYAEVKLDTAPFMAAAHRLYAAHGFVPCAPYRGTEVPAENQAGWLFFHARCVAPAMATR